MSSSVNCSLRHLELSFGQTKSPALRPGFSITEREWLVTDVDLSASGAEFHLDDASPLLLDALLFSEPAVVGDPLGKEGVL